MVLTVVLGCSCRLSVRTEIETDSWIEASTQNFVLITDLPVQRGKEVARELENYWSALASAYGLFLPKRTAPAEPMHVVHFAKCSDFKQLIWREGIGGFVVSSLDFEARRVMVTCDKQLHRQEVLVHELAHNFNNQFFFGGPRWLNEGLAGYFQSVAFNSKNLELGAPLMTDGTTWSRPRSVPTVRDLRAGAVEDAGRRFHLNSWRLVHLLITTTSDRRRRFRQMLHALANGESHERAWEVEFGEIEQALEVEFKKYLKDRQVGVFSIPRPKQSNSAIEIRKLPRHEAAGWLLQLRLVKANFVDEQETTIAMDDVTRQLQDITHPSKGFWEAVVAADSEGAGGRESQKAIKLLRSYAQSEPNDMRAVLGLVVLQLGDPGGGGVVEADVAKLSTNASTYEQLRVLGEVAIHDGDFARAKELLRRAIKRRTSCGGCFELLAKVAFAQGDLDEAVRAQRIAVGIGADDDDEELTRARKGMLDKYRRAKSQTGTSGRN